MRAGFLSQRILSLLRGFVGSAETDHLVISVISGVVEDLSYPNKIHVLVVILTITATAKAFPHPILHISIPHSPPRGPRHLQAEYAAASGHSLHIPASYHTLNTGAILVVNLTLYHICSCLKTPMGMQWKTS